MVSAHCTTLVIGLLASGIAWVSSAAKMDMSYSLGEAGMGRGAELQLRQKLKCLELCYRMDNAMGWDQRQGILWWASAADWS